MKRALLLRLPLLLMALCTQTQVQAQVHPQVHTQEWPRVPLPKEARAFDVGGQITHNGVPMRLQGFVSTTPPDQLLELFRQRLGQPLVESRLGRQQILGRMQGDFYLSVQIEPAGQGSRGMAAVTHLKAARDSEDSTRQQVQHWTSRLPSGSRVLSHVSSRDGAKLSSHIVFANTHDESLNAERLKALLGDDGLVLQREASSTLFFKGAGKEAIVTIHRTSGLETTVVLNLVTQLAVSP